MSKPKIGVIVSGRGSNLQAIMDVIARGDLDLEIAVVISDNPEAFALERAKRSEIPAVAIARKTCASKEEFENKIDEALKNAKVDYVVLAGFMRILSGTFVSKWKHKIINIHPALLPSFTGLDAQGQALDYGVKIAGCTVHFVDEGMDTGPIIVQRVVPVLDDDTHDSLCQRILEQEHLALPEALKLLSEGKLTIKGRKVIIEK